MTAVEPYDPVAAMEEQVRLAERRASAIRLRNLGASVPKVALALGYTDAAEAQADLIAGLREINMIPAAEMVARHQAIIMDLTRACYSNALTGDTNSVKAIRELMDHQAKLFGLYAPTRQRVAIGDDMDFTSNAATLLEDLGVSTVIDIGPTIDAGEPWA